MNTDLTSSSGRDVIRFIVLGENGLQSLCSLDQGSYSCNSHSGKASPVNRYDFYVLKREQLQKIL